MTARASIRITLLAVAMLLAASARGGNVATRDDVLACAAPFELQLIRQLDFGRIAMHRDRPGQVDADADGGYRQLGGAFVSLPPAAAELQLCGPPAARFELRIDAAVASADTAAKARGAAQLAPGSLHVTARGAELRRLGATQWEGVVGEGGRVSIRIAGRLDISSRAGPLRPAFRIRVSLRSL